MDNLNSKKFILSGVLIVCATVLVVMNKLDALSWITFTGAVFAAYTGANLGEQYMNRDTPEQTSTQTTVTTQTGT